MKMYGRSRTLYYFVLPALLLAACTLQPTSAQAQMTSVGIDCSQIQALGILKQDNMRAGRVLIDCGLVQGGRAAAPGDAPPAPPNIRVSNRTCTNAQNCTKSESMVWASSVDPTIVVNYNDHNANQYSGTSYSTDGGAHFTEILPPPFAAGHGTNFGDPIVVFNAKLGTWFAGDLATGCGGQGIGLWTSNDGITWTVGACAHNGGSDDRESMWVDNEPTSGTYGRMYVSWNDFTVGVGATSVTHSDNGTSWSAPVRIANGSTFIRDVQITGSPVGAPRFEGANSTVFVAGMDEGAGGCDTRQNLMYKSLDGGVTWTSATLGPRFKSICDGLCDNPYFAKVNTITRHMGWGEPGVGPNGVVHYAYAGLGRQNSDPGDIYYVRSTDNGVTWSTPKKLNGSADAQFKSQWMPSLSVDLNGKVTVAWYDRSQATTACHVATDPGCQYRRVARQSADNGATFMSQFAISPLMSQPEQPDPGVQACYAGDYDYNTTLNGNAFITWTDGRRSVGGTHVQDVGFAAVPLP
ncbi:MAG: hypothetical protein LAN63_02935 [Acidobacteriia bacterium]|nr:hypothetical protein [Terriglobia bacterium]